MVVCACYPCSSSGLSSEKGDKGLWIVGKADTRGSARFISRSCLRRLGPRFMGKPSSRTLVGVSRTVRLWGSSRMLRLLGGPFSCFARHFSAVWAAHTMAWGQVKTRRNGRRGDGWEHWNWSRTCVQGSGVPMRDFHAKHPGENIQTPNCR
jgi:hypothetical protein